MLGEHRSCKILLNSYTFPFLYLKSLSCLIVIAGTINKILNNNGDSEHFCLIPKLIGAAPSVSPSSRMVTFETEQVFYHVKEAFIHSYFECFL